MASVWLKAINPFQSTASRKQAVTEAWRSAGVHIGSWGTPEFGVSEAAAKGTGGVYTPQGGSNLFGPLAPTGDYIPPKREIIPPTTGGNGNLAGYSFNMPSINPPDFSQINQQTNDFGAIIDREYNDTIGALLAQEQGLQGQAATAQQQIGNEYSGVKTQLGNEQATQEQGIQGQLSTAETQSSAALRQARDLFRQTQQSNIAQLSGLGISSSSVTEALAERLGVETARRIAGITGSLNEIRLNATKEIGRIKGYFQDKLTNLENQKATRLSEVQNSLMAGLSQINAARNAAATAKARQRLELLANAQSAIAGLQSQYDNFKYQLAMWAQEKAASLQPIAQNPDYIKTLMAQSQTLNQQFQPSGFSYAPSLSYDKYGNVTGKISPYKKDEFLSSNAGIGNPEDPTFWQ